MAEDASRPVAIVTGANSGVGFGVAWRLAEARFRVVMLCRNQRRGAAAMDALRSRVEAPQIELLLADLSDYDAVRAFADTFRQRYQRLDVLVNAAGVVSMRRQLTPRGHELTLAAGFLGPALLTRLLVDPLRDGGGRIVNVSGRGHRRGTLVLDDLHFERRPYSAMKSGTQAVLAKLMFTYELARRLRDTGVTANACCPGLVRSKLLRSAPVVLRALSWPYLRLKGQTPYEGARTPAWLASAPELEGMTGRYYRRMAERRSSEASYDEAVAAQLWQLAERETQL